MHDDDQGIPMICATGAIKTGPVRIGNLGGDFNLGRTIALPVLIAVLVGALVGVLFALVVPGSASVQKFGLAMVFGGLFGYVLSSYSPLKGESLLTWLGLQVKTLSRQRTVRGEVVIVSVGVAELDRDPLGEFRLVRGAVRVARGRLDERGAVVSAKNKNLPEGAHVFGNHVYDPAVVAARRTALAAPVSGEYLAAKPWELEVAQSLQDSGLSAASFVETGTDPRVVTHRISVGADEATLDALPAAPPSLPPSLPQGGTQ